MFFALCTHSLRALELGWVRIIGSEPLGISDLPTPAKSAPHAQITNLGLYEVNPSTISWFFDPQCPFDLTHLQTVDVCESFSPQLVQILQQARSSIAALRSHALILCSAQAHAVACAVLLPPFVRMHSRGVLTVEFY
ncbi:hypothetical protein FB451DRAFT_1176317 [Mycena latifolia]|nr:hypothetical protein FB451DRAFT_1176317 [Mycena latifolia]